MVKLSKLHYNYKVTIFDKIENEYKEVKTRLYSQLTDIQQDYPHLTLTEVRYLSKHDSTVRTNPKFKGMTIQKIHPISIYGIGAPIQD